jgi:cysteine-rich repeat protein
MARLANGTSFAVAWHRSVDEAWAAIVSLCAPGAPLCGNGTVDGVCEQCDAGPGNSDATPDACRTSCRLPRCGDGVVDAGEGCDDGNLTSCDGCSSTCAAEAPGWLCGDGLLSPSCGEQCDDGAGNSDVMPDACRSDCRSAACGDGVVDGGESCDDANNFDCDGCSAACLPEPGAVCGDGVVEPTCHEACDDGNAVVGDGCGTTCDAELVPGRGAPTTDCLVEWSVTNPTNLPLTDDGAFRVDQICHDGDPLCDFDGVAGQCTFHVRVCADNTNLPACEPPERLAGWTITSPSVNKAVRDPVAAAIRTAFLGTVPGAIVGPSTRDLCSPVVEAVVPLRQPGDRPRKLVLKTRADTYGKAKDKDQLKLTCVP